MYFVNIAVLRSDTASEGQKDQFDILFVKVFWVSA